MKPTENKFFYLLHMLFFHVFCNKQNCIKNVPILCFYTKTFKFIILGHLRESHILEQNEVLRKRPDVPPWAGTYLFTKCI